ncbi:hypothetical protein CHN51_00105 [Sphingorhabdus sp. YGSMI21]|nr:hypothetical protein CHN51_00105 [Sphingorhabdus sp. YGSMI21]
MESCGDPFCQLFCKFQSLGKLRLSVRPNFKPPGVIGLVRTVGLWQNEICYFQWTEAEMAIYPVTQRRLHRRISRIAIVADQCFCEALYEQ